MSSTATMDSEAYLSRPAGANRSDLSERAAALLDSSLPLTPPGLAMQIVQATSRPDCGPAEIIGLINRDPALCANLLKVVNSSLFALSNPITSVGRAVVTLGIARVRSLVLGLSLSAMQIGNLPDDSLREFWISSVGGAMIARELAVQLGRDAPDDDMVAGLLRDLGAILLQRNFPEQWVQYREHLAKRGFVERCDIELEIFGIDHAELGAELLRRWNLPAELVESIREHHRPERWNDLPIDVGDRAELLYFAEFLSQLETVVAQPDSLNELLQFGRESFGYDWPELIALLEGVGPRINEFIGLLSIKAGESPDYSKILASGCVELVSLTVQTMTPDTLLSSMTSSLVRPPSAGGGHSGGSRAGADSRSGFASSTYSDVKRPPTIPGLPEFRLEHLENLPKEGCCLDGYVLRSRLGRGAMGVVFRAFESNLDREVAIKMLLPGTNTPATRKRFLMEARTAAAVRHENVVTVYAVRDYDTFAYLVMEFITGKSLQGIIDQPVPVPIADIARWVRQIASGLAASHAKGIVHRDIKPDNLLLEEHSKAIKITDFGLARGGEGSKLSANGTLAGTPLYMSPEQACGNPTGPLSDLFSLGSVAYALCTGRSPFHGRDTLVSLLYDIANAPVIAPQSIRPDVPDWMNEMILGLLEKDPLRRTTSADVESIISAHANSLKAR